jgi:hypothetical protein
MAETSAPSITLQSVFAFLESRGWTRQYTGSDGPYFWRAEHGNKLWHEALAIQLEREKPNTLTK